MPTYLTCDFPERAGDQLRPVSVVLRDQFGGEVSKQLREVERGAPRGAAQFILVMPRPIALPMVRILEPIAVTFDQDETPAEQPAES